MATTKVKEPKIAMLDSLRSIGYDFNSALADILDNSISAKAKNIDIYLIERIPAVVICDDGVGMSFDELDVAMDLGSKSPNEDRDPSDLGRYGLGLKSASFSQCRNLTVTSLKDGKMSSMTWDLKKVEDEQDWIISINDESEIESLPYINYIKDAGKGTIVMWSDFDRLKLGSDDLRSALASYLREAGSYLALVFHKFLARGQIKIRIGGHELKQMDPLLSNNKTKAQHRKPQIIAAANKKCEVFPIEIIPHILPYIKDMTEEELEKAGGRENIRNLQGFYIYRSDRLITWGTWLRMIGVNELYKNARIEVNIPNTLDDIWEVDVKKAKLSIPPNIRQQLVAKINEATQLSSDIPKKRIPRLSSKYQKVWKVETDRDGMSYFSINRELPVLNQLEQGLSNEQRTLLNVFISNIEHNIPQMALYTLVAQDKFKDDKEGKRKETIEAVDNILKLYESASSQEKIMLLKAMFQSEPYCNYLDIYEEKLKELESR